MRGAAAGRARRQRPGRLSLFVVPAGAPGLTLKPIPTALVSPDRQFTVFLDDVAVGEDALIGVAGQGFRQVFAGLNPERILTAALYNGVGRYAVAKAAEYARQRTVTRLMRTAPVSREMVLNYLATHSLGLPQSY